MSEYIEQFDRVTRFLNRVRSGNRESVEYVDDLWAFFQNSWHLKDWVKNDSSLEQRIKDLILASVDSSQTLLICGALANRSKHLKLWPQWNDANITGRNVSVFPGQNKPAEYTHNVALEDGSVIVAQQLAEEVFEAWTKILATHSLI